MKRKPTLRFKADGADVAFLWRAVGEQDGLEESGDGGAGGFSIRTGGADLEAGATEGSFGKVLDGVPSFRGRLFRL